MNKLALYLLRDYGIIFPKFQLALKKQNFCGG